jgi:hypothetical protein
VSSESEEAYGEYLLGRHERHRGTEEEVARSIEQFWRAIAADPS